MKEVMDGFKVVLEELMNEMYQKLDELVDDAMYSMSFFSNDGDANYKMLQEAMIEMLLEQMKNLLDVEEESN